MADVVREEEAYLSCLLSDYDRHADLSTDAEDLADTDSEGSVHHLDIELPLRALVRRSRPFRWGGKGRLCLTIRALPE